LVVMCLLELTKLQMSGLGYKMCTQITKVFKSHAIATQHTLEQYNKLADKMKPPCLHLLWDNIVDCFFLAGFSLPCKTNLEILAKWWANPPCCMLAAQHFDSHCVEKITQCNVEILQLLTKIYDDQVDMPLAIKRINMTDLALATEAQ
ncbi:hypothetical protein CONPUDRAFT_58518, partial [Coniophora puteana RWD-64-598 SS2]